MAIQNYLVTHHSYSLSVEMGPGDPINEFLLNEGRAAHCQYFASAAVILLRCMGIPARYVSGFYAHEPTGDGLVVRQRDAHAWAECWIDGLGWMTVEATPASGLPDRIFPPAPAWRVAWEHATDWAKAIGQWFVSLNWIKMSMLAAGAMVMLAPRPMVAQRPPWQVLRPAGIRLARPGPGDRRPAIREASRTARGRLRREPHLAGATTRHQRRRVAGLRGDVQRDPLWNQSRCRTSPPVERSARSDGSGQEDTMIRSTGATQP